MFLAVLFYMALSLHIFILNFAFIPNWNLVDFKMRTGVSWGHFAKLFNEFGFLKESIVVEGVVCVQNIINHTARPKWQWHHGFIFFRWVFPLYFTIFLLITARRRQVKRHVHQRTWIPINTDKNVHSKTICSSPKRKYPIASQQ